MPFCGDNKEGKSTLWANIGQDRNFRRTLRAIGPYLFLGKFMWTNHWSIPFPGEFVWTNGPESSSKVFPPYTGIGPWMALPRRKGRRKAEMGCEKSCLIHADPSILMLKQKKLPNNTLSATSPRRSFCSVATSPTLHTTLLSLVWIDCQRQHQYHYQMNLSGTSTK